MGSAEKLLTPNPEFLMEMFKAHEHFCKVLLDAYVLLDIEGHVIKCNPAVSAILGKKPRQLLKPDMTLSHFIKFLVDQKPLDVRRLLEIRTPTRFDEVAGIVKGDDEEEREFNLILGVYPFWDGNDLLGGFILMRDVTAETALQGKYRIKATQSITDPLTGLYNRHYFEQYLKKLGAGGDHNVNLPVSVVMADIDHFKMINDTYGHQAGDLVLEQTAEIFRSIFRRTDVLCRYGGEEFLAILPSTDINGATGAAEKLREALASKTFQFNSTEINVTISLGLSEINFGQENPMDAIGRADNALYHAKYSGRNRVCVHRGQDVIEIVGVGASNKS